MTEASGEGDGRATRWEGHRRERRRELVNAAVRAIRAHGAGVGMDEIAAAAATSKTVFYRHFTDRTGLHQAIAERVDAQIMAGIGRAVARASAAVSSGPNPDIARVEPRDLIRASIDAYLELVEKDPEVYRFVTTSGPDRGPAAGDPAQIVANAVAVQIAALIAEALEARGSDPSPAPVWGHGMVGMVRAAADDWLRRRDRMPRPVLTDLLTDLAWSGVSSALTPR